MSNLPVDPNIIKSFVSQDGAKAEGSVVAGDQLNHNGDIILQLPASQKNLIDQLKEKLTLEIAQNSHTKEIVGTFHRYKQRRSHDGVDGLEAKLAKANRANETFDALDKKEMFVKLLDKWSLYASAQEIFALLLAKADYEYNQFIFPEISTLTRIQENYLIDQRIVQPTLEACNSSTVLSMDHCTALGMLYWLAEQCFVRWHE